MKASKTLTTLSVAALLAAGGIAVAQTTGGSGDMSSNATLSNNASSDLGATTGSTTMSGTGSSTLGASSDTATLGSDTGTLDANNSNMVAQADRG